ncbi:MAG: hypothetical protein OJF50_003562 [Nitrospira sp.]|jgi:hypothetical protein|nr:hypothetical protein [Nitrospira sp.]
MSAGGTSHCPGVQQASFGSGTQQAMCDEAIRTGEVHAIGGDRWEIDSAAQEEGVVH